MTRILTPQESVMAFIQSVKMVSPALAARVEAEMMTRAESGQLSGLGAVTVPNTMTTMPTVGGGSFDWMGLLNTVGSTVSNLASQYVTSTQRMAEFKLNLERAKQGQPPVVVMPDGSSATVLPNSAAPATGNIGGLPVGVWLIAGGALFYLMSKKAK